MVGTRHWRRRNVELVFNVCRVSVWEAEQGLETDDGDGAIIVSVLNAVYT